MSLLKVLASKWKNVNGIKYFPTQDKLTFNIIIMIVFLYKILFKHNTFLQENIFLTLGNEQKWNYYDHYKCW
jgi:hypothetical protein